MLTFLLPNSTCCSKSSSRQAVNQIKTLTRNRRLPQRVALPPNRRWYADDARELDEAGDGEALAATKPQGEHVRWLMTEGMQYKRPREDGPNWLGGNVPFPSNPTFKPPTPISDKTKTQIFNLHLRDKISEQELSQRFGLGIGRIKAILRLKKLEQLWMKACISCLPLPTRPSHDEPKNRLVLKT
ncbi:hypothetical protein CPB86DRAFT_265014 [Serendipita vermifera]|nr:hypothetical protein CPB86DRAFT_265014 [Serendipita vermifera]